MAQGFYEGRERSTRRMYSGGLSGSRAEPEEWIPVLLDVYEGLSRILKRYGARPIIAGAGAYGVNVEFDPTKDVDIVLSKPLDVAKLTEVMKKLVEDLKSRGWRVVGARIQLGRSSDDWVIQIFIPVRNGRVVGVEVFNLLVVRPASLYETTQRLLDHHMVETLTLESWFASKLVDPNGVDEGNLRRLEKAVEHVDVAKLFGILRRLALPGIVSENAKDILKRTENKRLREVLSYLA